jgi:hypothetical protein
LLAETNKVIDTFGKIIITWNPNDNIPTFPPEEQQVEYRFIVNATVTPEIDSRKLN